MFSTCWKVYALVSSSDWVSYLSLLKVNLQSLFFTQSKNNFHTRKETKELREKSESALVIKFGCTFKQSGAPHLVSTIGTPKFCDFYNWRI